MRPRQLRPPQRSDNRLQPAKCHAASKGGHNDEIGAAAFFAIRQLGAQDVGEAAFAHPRPAHDPFALQALRRRHDQHEIAALDPAAFKEQRDVEDDERHAARACPRDEPSFGSPHHRMDDPLKTAQRGWVAEHPLAQLPAIDPSRFTTHPGKRRIDRPDRRPSRPEKPVNLGIGIE